LLAEGIGDGETLAEDLPALTVHLRYPVRLRRRLRSTSFLDRSLEEVRRRTKFISRFPSQRSCLSRCWPVFDSVIPGAKGLGLTELDREHLGRLKEPPGCRENIAEHACCSWTRCSLLQHAPDATLVGQLTTARLSGSQLACLEPA
jgi:hypothetical protein